MRTPRNAFPLLFFLLTGTRSAGQEARTPEPTSSTPVIPKTWDDQAIATLEVPLANPIGSPKHVSSSYYYRIPVAPIYKTYPVYAPGHEPPGYMDRLKQEEPVVVWDEKGHVPPRKTHADWIKAGEIVFNAPISFDQFATVADLRDASWYGHLGVPIAADGTIPFLNYVIRKKGTVEVGQIGCVMCHSRVMPDGSILNGAQGNFPTVRAWDITFV